MVLSIYAPPALALRLYGAMLRSGVLLMCFAIFRLIALSLSLVICIISGSVYQSI